jgi:small-conductance mechanosensitive channel
MKKIILAALLAVFSHVTNAQSSEEVVSKNIDTIVDTTPKAEALDDRLTKQETELKALKKDNELLKNQVKQIKSSLPNSKRKFTVSRAGSKQIVVE